MHGVRPRRVVVVGAGIGGLAAAIPLAAAGLDVTLLERAAAPGGKMRELAVGDRHLDGGPTVFTMRWVFEALFAEAGASLSDHVTLLPAEILARHAWQGGTTLDLFADLDRSTDAIGAFAGAAEARGFLAFCAESRRIYETLETSFIRGPRPTPVSLVRDAGWRGLGDLLAIKPFETMWAALGRHFRDPRLRQLFGRYATYCGSSPFAAPATLMLVAHVEREGVWLVQGGMHRLAVAMADLLVRLGGTIRYGSHVEAVAQEAGRACGVLLAGGERLEAGAVVVNADAAAVAGGMLGAGAVARSIRPLPASGRSLSAITWGMEAACEGFPLTRHNVFFSADYEAEFKALAAGRLPGEPTVYVCAQDRLEGGAPQGGPERLLCLVNAPPIGEGLPAEEIEACAHRTFSLLERCGLRLDRTGASVTTPAGFGALFPATGGALYGQAVHGAMASFRRPGAVTRLPGLYLAGGSTHPGAGVPMAALSGRQAALSVMRDFGLGPSSTGRSRPGAMPGGTSMR